jgi:hypothetical protein
MRKVYLTVKATVNIPVTVTYNAIVLVDEGKSLEPVAKSVISGKIPDYADLEDSSIETVTVTDAYDLESSFEEQVSEYLTSDHPFINTPKFVGFEVTDSK